VATWKIVKGRERKILNGSDEIVCNDMDLNEVMNDRVQQQPFFVTVSTFQVLTP
jgi:hypothetical protein